MSIWKDVLSRYTGQVLSGTAGYTTTNIEADECNTVLIECTTSSSLVVTVKGITAAGNTARAIPAVKCISGTYSLVTAGTSITLAVGDLIFVPSSGFYQVQVARVSGSGEVTVVSHRANMDALLLTATGIPVVISGTSSVNLAQVNGQTVDVGNGTAGTGTQRVTIASNNTAFTVDTELPAAVALADNASTPTAPAVGAFGMLYDGSTWDLARGTSADGALVNLGANDDTRAGARTDVLYDASTAVTPKFAILDVASSGDNTAIAAVTSKKIRVLALFLVSAGTVNVRFESGASGTALTGQMNLVANSGFTLPPNQFGWFETASNTLLNIELSAGVSVDGCIVYCEI